MDDSSASPPVSDVEFSLSVVVPTYNEEGGLEAFHRRLLDAIAPLTARLEVLYVNDGSTDRSLDEMRRLAAADPRISIVDLSRNFGKEIAMTAGLDHAVGDAVVIIDADLQDPPELIPTLVENWRQGFDVVYAKRVSREGESAAKRLTAHAFYRVMQRMGGVGIPEDTGDFRLLSRRAVNALATLRERHRFMKGLFAWIGFPQKAVEYRRDPRHSGSSKFTYWKLWNFALEGITSFTTVPLRIATYLGVAVAGLSFLFALFIVYKTLVYGDPVAGYPSLVVIVAFLGGVQLCFTGVLGEYIGRMFMETKRRPLYLLNAYLPASTVSGCRRSGARSHDVEGARCPS